MGLDLFHVKPCAAPVVGMAEYFDLHELEACPGFIERHRHLLTSLSYPDELFSIFIFAGVPHLRLYEHLFGKQEDDMLLTGNMQDLMPLIRQTETEKNLAQAQRTDIESSFNHGPITIDFQIIQYRTVIPDKEVLYWEQHGYQRKQMHSRFYEEFINNKLYFSIDEVLLAYEFIEPCKEEETETPLLFRQNFVDNFEGGTSIFFPSW
ncbi:hypothetical protein [Chitinophaga sp. HK235]|uniref:hypothetical protein n=1 Tax=Chitinophaga sp. HK235 TaxID=2952571 RepID=UPI001BAC6669|nr:hypothetical protein [Chitinophaga sp. HK235]